MYMYICIQNIYKYICIFIAYIMNILNADELWIDKFKIITNIDGNIYKDCIKQQSINQSDLSKNKCVHVLYKAKYCIHIFSPLKFVCI